ncbi:hypothetical protein [Paracoccus sp. Z118]|nr:hypothetical protein [Paracoccus sp. Z118]
MAVATRYGRRGQLSFSAICTAVTLMFWLWGLTMNNLIMRFWL